jgi:hypothetical protein
MEWTADIVSEPARGHQLCVDLSEGETFRARIERNDGDVFELVVYEGPLRIPAEWLAQIIERFIADKRSIDSSKDVS